MRTKLHQFSNTAPTLPHDVLFLTETWLDSNINTAELGLPTHNIYRLDRNKNTSSKSRGGGVLLAISKTLVSRKLTTTYKNVEHIFSVVNTNKKNKIILGCVYIPPSSDQIIYRNHMDEIQILISKYPETKIIIAGDYNLPNINWDPLSSDLPRTNNSSISDIEREILEMSNFLNLNQLNVTKNSNDRILDLVFSNVKSVTVTKSSEILLPLDNYHPSLDIAINNTICENPKIKLMSHNFHKANYIEICNFLLKVDWSFLNDGELNENIEHFYCILKQAIKSHVPVTSRNTSTFPKWFNNDLINLVLQKKIAHHKFKTMRTLHDYTEFHKLRKQCAVTSDKCYKNYIKEVETSIKSNVKSFFNYSKSLQNNYASIPSIMNYGGKTCTKTEDIVNLFADFFKSVYEDDISVDSVPEFVTDFNLQLSDLSIERNDIIASIKLMEPKTSSGPDNIPPIFLKNCVNSLSYPLYLIFNKSLKTGQFPNSWKSSYLTPVFKKGSKNDVCNYRPICILSSIPKLFEKIILSKISSNIKHVITNCQHGFVSSRSTLTNLTVYVNYINTALTNRKQVDSVYTDFSKAFDKVCHKILINKLVKMGIRGNLLAWLISYLSDRLLFVKINDCLSYEFIATSGVPQGSHLGPLLFILFINDVISIFYNVEVLLFADDMKLFKVINDVHDCIILQENLNNFFKWCSSNKLQLNINKCQVMRFHKIKLPIMYNYSLCNVDLISVIEILDLGIIFDQKLCFVSHITSIANRAMKMLGFIVRISKDFKNINTLKILFTSLVRSILEYNSTIWSPVFNNHINTIERVQRKFLRCINFRLGIPLETIDYDFLLHSLKLLKLSDRRKIFDLIFLYKIVNYLLDSPDILMLIQFHVPTIRSRSSSMYYCDNYTTVSGYNSVINRLQTLGNFYAKIADIHNMPLVKYKAALITYFNATYCNEVST